MTIYGVDSFVIGNRNVIGLNSNEFAVLLMSGVNSYVSPAVTALP